MKNKTRITLVGFLVMGISLSAQAKVDVLCEKKRDHVIQSVCAKSSSVEKKKECISFYKNASCGTVALHEQTDSEL